MLAARFLINFELFRLATRSTNRNNGIRISVQRITLYFTLLNGDDSTTTTRSRFCLCENFNYCHQHQCD